MSGLKKPTGYAISAASATGALALLVDRYGEFVTGAESFASWSLPPLALAVLAVSTLVTVKLGHPSKSETDA